MKRDHCKNGNSFTNRHLQLALHVSIYLQCISPHGCTFGRFQLQHRCKQSYHGKRQPGSYRLQTQSEVSRKSMNWNMKFCLNFNILWICVSEVSRWCFTRRVLDIGNDLIAICVHRNKIPSVSVQHQPPATHKAEIWENAHHKDPNRKALISPALKEISVSECFVNAQFLNFNLFQL